MSQETLIVDDNVKPKVSESVKDGVDENNDKRERFTRLKEASKRIYAKLLKEAPKTLRYGRNHRCYCGSGARFKNCCIDKRDKSRHLVHNYQASLNSIFKRVRSLDAL